MGRPPHDPDRIPTRDRVLRAAAGAFADEGLARATLADIGRRAGISRPSLLHHFATKDVLYAEVVQVAFGALGDQLAATMAPAGSLVDRLVALAERFEAFLEERPEIARLIVRELLADGPGQRILLEQVVPLIDRVEAYITTTAGRSLPAGFPLRAALLQVASGVLVQAATPIREALWRDPPQTALIVRRLFAEEVLCSAP